MKSLSQYIKFKFILSFISYPTLWHILLPILLAVALRIFIFLPTVYAEGFWLGHIQDPVIPNKTMNKEPEPDGNLSGEDAAYNQRDPLPKEEPSPQEALEESNERITSHDHLLSKELTIKRIAFIDAIQERIQRILDHQYPKDTSIPPESIKNATYIVLTQHGNLPDWMAKTPTEINDPYHEINLHIHLIQKLIEKDTQPGNTKNILTHMATCIQMINSAHILGISDKIESDLLKPECYDELYKRYKNNNYE